jgi:hypothetical protein
MSGKFLEQITQSWRTKQRWIFVAGKGQRRAPAVRDEANRLPNEPRKFQVSHASVEIDYGELRLVNTGAAALRQVNSDTARDKKTSLRLRHDK